MHGVGRGWLARPSSATMHGQFGIPTPLIRLPITEFVMSSTPTEELIERLRRSVRRWMVFVLILLVGFAVVSGTAIVQMKRAEHAEAAWQAEMETRLELE